MFSHFSLHRLAFRRWPNFCISAATSSHNGPFGPFSWYFVSMLVRILISASISGFGHRELWTGELLLLSVGGGATAVFGGDTVVDGGGG
nr:hypothetical protein Itr_chr01CG23700 [Ipomoea trifida]